MKRMPRLLPALLPLFCLALAVQAEAKPVAATIYPAGAMVTEEAEAVPADGRITLTLPAGADTGTLSVALSRGGVLNRTVTPLPGQPSPAVLALQKEADALHALMDMKRAELAGVISMRQFWTRPPYSISAPSVEMANSLMERFAKESRAKLDGIARQEAALRAELRGLEHRLSALEARIRELGKQNAGVLECSLAVDGTGNGPVSVRWSYWLGNAGWHPLYRVAVDSVTGNVRIGMQAALSQKSGMDWEGVELTLASSDRLSKVAPPALRPWVIGQDSHDAAPRVMLAKAAPRANAEAAAAPASSDEAGLTWALGRMDLPAASTVTRLVGLHELDAKFSRLLRPGRSSDIWLCASLEDAALAGKPFPLLPAGQASFLVDGRETARGAFSLGPSSRDIFFGIDQLMKAETDEVAASTALPASPDGETRQWSWNTRISNGHDKAVALRVEEAAPIARESGVQIRVFSEPPARLEKDRSRYAWELSIPARQNADVRFEVKAGMPERK